MVFSRFGQACPLLVSFWLFFCLWTSKMFNKPSLGALLLVMKISLIKGQFFLISPLCFEIQRCLGEGPLGTFMLMKISLDGQFILIAPFCLWNSEMLLETFHLVHLWS